MRRLLIFCAVAVTAAAQTVPYDSLYLKSTVYKNMTAFFSLSRRTSADVVFLGNSITAGADWSDLLGRERIVNRGIPGDNTLGMLHRLISVTSLHPKVCFLMAGINDLYADAPVETIMKNYAAIVDSLRSAKITVIIQSTLHVNPKWKRTEEKNPLVAQLNSRLKEYAQRNGLLFVDVNAVLSTNGVLNDEYTSDGVHLTPAAYARWRDLLLPVLQQFGL